VDYHTAIGEPRPPAPTPSYAPAPIQRQEGARESLSGRIAVASPVASQPINEGGQSPGAPKVQGAPSDLMVLLFLLLKMRVPNN